MEIGDEVLAPTRRGGIQSGPGGEAERLAFLAGHDLHLHKTLFLLSIPTHHLCHDNTGGFPNNDTASCQGFRPIGLPNILLVSVPHI